MIHYGDMHSAATTGIKSYWWRYLCPWYHCCGSCRHVKEYLLKYLVIFNKRRRNKLGCLKYKGAFVTGWYGSPATDPRFATEYCEFSPFLVLCAFFQRILWFFSMLSCAILLPQNIVTFHHSWFYLRGSSNLTQITFFIALPVSLPPITLMKISCEPFKTVFMSYWSSFLITLYL